MRIEVRFSKIGEMRYISRLDLMRLFRRTIRRANIPVLVTRGFTPHLKISIKRALKLGLESDEEIAYFYLENYIKPGELIKKMNEISLYVKKTEEDYCKVFRIRIPELEAEIKDTLAQEKKDLPNKLGKITS